jgi:hypothetical protein
MAQRLHAAWLRVYEPLAAFPESERAGWLARVRSGELSDRKGAAEREHDLALRAAVRRRVSVAGGEQDHQALAEVVDGITYLCPLALQQRVWEAAVTVREGHPPLLADALLSRELAEEARLGLAAARAGTGAALPRTHVRCAPWAVPLAWFMLVDVGDRCPERDEVRYLTTLGAARRRATQALAVLQRTIPEAPTVQALVAVAGWLEGFHRQSRVELDYGSLAELLSPQERQQDLSPGDLAEALRELTAGRALPAAAAYERVLARWRPLQSRENSS